MNPSFAARRIERKLAVWVRSVTGSPGKRAREPVGCRCARLGVPASPCLRQEQVAELSLSAVRTDVTLTIWFAPIERDHADRRSIEIDYEKP
jgi:hypothetical protein